MAEAYNIINSKRSKLLAALKWQIDIGVDESIGDRAFSRFNQIVPNKKEPNNIDITTNTN